MQADHRGQRAVQIEAVSSRRGCAVAGTFHSVNEAMRILRSIHVRAAGLLSISGEP